MNNIWKLQEAKNKLSALVNYAQQLVPQIITRHGQPVAVLISIQEYQQLKAKTSDLSHFFQNSPLADVELDLQRTTDIGRDIEI